LELRLSEHTAFLPVSGISPYYQRRVMHNKIIMKALVSLSLLAAVAAANAFIVFDDFSTSQSAVVLTSLGTASNTLAVGPLSRKQEINVIAYNDPDGFERAYTRIANGAWIGSSDVQVQGVWNMVYGMPSAYLGGPNTFAIDFSTIDQNAVVLVTWVSGSSVATGQANVSAGNSLQTILVNATNVGSGFDWSNVTSVQFSISGPSGLDFKIDQIQTEAVPEPASIIALGLGGLAILRRKRKA